MINAEQSGIGLRLLEEIELKYGSLRGAAQAMGLRSGAYFRSYTTEGGSIPGMTLRKKLLMAGLDVGYIMTGDRSVHPVQAPINKQIALNKAVNNLQQRLTEVTRDLENLSNMISNS